MDRSDEKFLSFFVSTVVILAAGFFLYEIAANAQLSDLWHGRYVSEGAKIFWIFATFAIGMACMILAININPLNPNAAFEPSRAENIACTVLWLAALADIGSTFLLMGLPDFRPLIVSFFATLPAIPFSLYKLNSER